MCKFLTRFISGKKQGIYFFATFVYILFIKFVIRLNFNHDSINNTFGTQQGNF